MLSSPTLQPGLRKRDPGFETVAYGDHPDQVADVRRGGSAHRDRRPRRRLGARPPLARTPGRWRSSWRSAVDDAAPRRSTGGHGVADTLADMAAVLDVTGPGAAIGHFAGGHLVLWAAGTGKIDRAISLAGVTDLARAARDGIGSNAAVEFAGPDPPAHADPMRRLPLTVPVLLAHGTEDDRVPFDYSRSFATASGAESLTLPGAGHFEVIDPRTPEWALIAARL